MKKNIFTIWIIGISLFLSLTVTGQKITVEAKAGDLKAKVQALNDKMARAMVAGDNETVYSMYADDIVLMPNYSPMVRGLKAIKEGDDEMEEAGVKITAMTLTTLEVMDLGDIVYEIGTYGMAMEMPEMSMPWADKGKYVTIFRKLKEGSLEILVDIWNTDVNPWEAMQKKD
jgi:ketosteroid isomerase-like protein